MKTRKRVFMVALAVTVSVWLALNMACAYPIFGWHPYACLCDICLERFEADGPER